MTLQRTVASYMSDVPQTPMLIVNMWKQIIKEKQKGIYDNAHDRVLSKLHCAVTKDFNAQMQFQRNVIQLLHEKDSDKREYVFQQEKLLTYCLAYSPFTKVVVDIIKEQKNEWSLQQVHDVRVMLENINQECYTETSLDSYYQFLKALHRLYNAKLYEEMYWE